MYPLTLVMAKMMCGYFIYQFYSLQEGLEYLQYSVPPFSGLPFSSPPARHTHMSTVWIGSFRAALPVWKTPSYHPRRLTSCWKTVSLWDGRSTGALCPLSPLYSTRVPALGQCGSFGTHTLIPEVTEQALWLWSLQPWPFSMATLVLESRHQGELWFE